jgi:hypothetical protein
MKKHIILILSITCTLLIQSCRTEDCCLPTPNGNNNRINFSNLQVGQKSIYIQEESSNWRKDSDTTFKKTVDTLHLKVIDKDNNGFKVEEFHFNKKRPTLAFYFNVVGDSLRVTPVPSTSSIGSATFMGNEQSYTFNEQNLTKWVINRWVIPQDVPFGKRFGYVENIKINNLTIGKAIGYYDSTSTIFDGPYTIKLYSKEAGFISFQTLGSMAAGGAIWNLIP